MTSMFWGLRLEPGKRYSTTVGRSFHVSMAALDCTTVKNENEVNCVMLEESESDVPFILCNLQKQKSLQCPLDLNFLTGDRITFFCKGNGTIHLSGYVHEDPDDDDLNLLGEEEEEEDEEEVEDAEDEEDAEEEEDDEDDVADALKKLAKKTPNGLSNKRSLDAKVKPAKRAKVDSLNEEEDSEDEDDEDDDVEGSVEEEEEESEEEVESPQPQKPLKQKNKNKQSQEKQKNEGVIENAQLTKKTKKKGDGAKPNAVTNAVLAKPQKVAPQKKTLEGGVQIKDVKLGAGPPCKTGQRATVYYIGRLKGNNKVFDSCKRGAGFTFTVGKGDVIKAWDVAVAGMQAGGKRTIICPPSMAYGAKGAPPSIPPNSTLVFEVELRNFK